MKLRMLVPAKDTKKVMKRLKQSSFQIEEQSHDPDLLQIGSNNVDSYCCHGNTCSRFYREHFEGVINKYIVINT